MNSQFHTPSFGDEIEIDTNTASVNNPQSKRMRSMDRSFDDYSSINDDGIVATNALINSNPALNATTTTTTTTTTLAARKQLSADTTGADVTGEPTKPLSAYALFFRDTVSAIKQQNPSCSFQDLSRIVASMWEALDPTHKNVYQKKNEIACNEYLNQMRLYRQYQVEQQQHLITSSNENISNNASLQTKPAVFTIECNNDSNNNNNALNTAIVGAPNKTSLPQPTSPQQQQQQITTSTQAQANESSLPQQQQQLYVTQMNNTTPAVESTAMTTTTANATLTDSTTPQQMLTEAGSVQKCTRENCNKRAIINPDWEDEYCSNECVVIHCRNVFNEWVKSNLDARKQ